MVMRSAVGALAVVAVLGAVAAALPERAAPSKASAPAKAPFGALASKDPAEQAKTDAAAASSDVSRADLLKLASFDATPKTPADGHVSSATVPTLATASPDPAPTAVGSPAVAPEVSADQAVRPTSPTVPADPAHLQRMASAPMADAVDGEVPPGLPEGDRATKPASGVGSLININTASIDALDHLPGAGRIGRAIANRRPYRTVDDLVQKRVLRDSAFRRIRPLIAVD